MRMFMLCVFLVACVGDVSKHLPGQEDSALATDTDSEPDDTDRPGERHCLDADADGYGSRDDCVVRETAPEGYIDNDLDCDDMDPMVHPDAEEVDEDVDEDCDGLYAEGECDAPGMWCLDDDDDGFGDPNNCFDDEPDPWHYVTNDNDCDDSSGSVHPGASEDASGGVDNDCDGLADEHWEDAAICVETFTNYDAFEVFARSPSKNDVWPMCLDATVAWPDCGVEPLITEVWGYASDEDQVNEFILGDGAYRACWGISADYGDDVVINALASRNGDVSLLYAGGRSDMRVWIDGEDSACAFDDDVYRCRRPFREERELRCAQE